jgi:hypothetical protein
MSVYLGIARTLPPVGRRGRAARATPTARRLDEQVEARRPGELVVAGGADVPDDGVRDV